MRTALRICFTAALISLTAASVQARIMRIITYDELFDKSDLAVIASPATKTTDANEMTYFDDDIASVDASGSYSKLPAVGVVTAFDVIKVPKGDRSIKQFVLHHYRDKVVSALSFGGPNTVSFDPSDPKRRRDALLFLIREKDGRYAPYGGQTDPNDRSIFALEAPP